MCCIISQMPRREQLSKEKLAELDRIWNFSDQRPGPAEQAAQSPERGERLYEHRFALIRPGLQPLPDPTADALTRATFFLMRTRAYEAGKLTIIPWDKLYLPILSEGVLYGAAKRSMELRRRETDALEEVLLDSLPDTADNARTVRANGTTYLQHVYLNGKPHTGIGFAVRDAIIDAERHDAGQALSQAGSIEVPVAHAVLPMALIEGGKQEARPMHDVLAEQVPIDIARSLYFPLDKVVSFRF